MTGAKTTSEAVRQLAASSVILTKKQAREALGISVDQAVSAFDNLVRYGWLIREEHGVYRFNERKEPAREASVEERIWRLCRMIKPSFSAAQLAAEGGTTTNYVYRLLRAYRAAGFIAAAGRKKALSGSTEKLWRLTPKGRTRRERPVIEEWTPDPLVALVVKLNRLVCTGLAARIPFEAENAVRLCLELLDGLEALRGESTPGA